MDGRTKTLDCAVQTHRRRARVVGDDMAVGEIPRGRWWLGWQTSNVRRRRRPDRGCGRAFPEFADPHQASRLGASPGPAKKFKNFDGRPLAQLNHTTDQVFSKRRNYGKAPQILLSIQLSQ